MGHPRLSLLKCATPLVDDNGDDFGCLSDAIDASISDLVSAICSHGAVGDVCELRALDGTMSCPWLAAFPGSYLFFRTLTADAALAAVMKSFKLETFVQYFIASPDVIVE